MYINMEVGLDPLKKLIITPELVNTIGQLDEFKGRWEALGNLAPERLLSLRRIATIESVGSSTRIEGARLTNDEVEKLLSGLETTSFRSRDEREVAGYAAAMDLIYESWQEIALNENHIFQLHSTLLQYTEKDAHHRGRYKTVPNNVEAFDETGRSLGVIFETATPFDTPRITKELVEWTRENLESGTHHALLIIAVFIVRFLAIHPFEDGNGRLSRILTTLLLLRAGYTYVPYSSLERIVEDNKEDYYIALRRAQSTLDGDESHLEDWVAFFIEILLRQKAALEIKLEREKLMSPLSPLSAMLLGIVEEHGRITVRSAVGITGANRNTIKAHLQRLVASGALAQRGRGKGTWYEKP
jgi:Fic family protein